MCVEQYVHSLQAPGARRQAPGFNIYALSLVLHHKTFRKCYGQKERGQRFFGMTQTGQSSHFRIFAGSAEYVVLLASLE